MAIKTELFGKTSDGINIDKITLTGKSGLVLNMINYGATVTGIIFEGKDIALGFDTVADYEKTTNYFGATIGRYGNRIANGKFTLGGITYDVGRNEGGHTHLHGGMKGFNEYVWDYEPVGDAAVKFSITDKDGANGYPGLLKVNVTYSVMPDNTICITYDAVSDKDTILNMTNHTYFNLNGYDGGNILDNVLTIYGEYITPIGEHLIPTGELMPVDGTPFDFRKPKSIGKDIKSDFPQNKMVNGFDHNYVIGADKEMKHIASAYSPNTGIHLECYSDQPGVQLYTGQSSQADGGKGGINLYPCQGFCLETQHYPDTPNKPDFPSCLLKAGEQYHTVTKYTFSK